MKANNILETIGNTPHVRLNRLFPKAWRFGLNLNGQTQVQA